MHPTLSIPDEFTRLLKTLNDYRGKRFLITAAQLDRKLYSTVFLIWIFPTPSPDHRSKCRLAKISTERTLK